MKSFKLISRETITAILVATTLNTVIADTIEPTIDDFQDPQKNSLGIERQHIDDTVVGGSSTTQYSVENGVFAAKGDIVPPRGQPGWASTVLLLDPQGLPKDVSSYKGIRLLVKVTKGNLSISANSSDITNYDYHAATITPKSDGKFHEVKISFSEMKRAWSAQTPLNTKTLESLSVVAFDIQKGSFEYEIEEISFY